MVKAQKLETEVKAKKKWYEILAPKMFNETVIGETIALTPNSIIGRSVTANLMNVTGNIKKQNINVKFQVTGIKDNKYAITDIISYEMMPAMIKRMVRRGRDTINDSFVVKTADEKYLRIKPFLITTANTSRQIIANLRRSTRYFIAKRLSEKKYYDFVSEVISSKFQSELNGFLRKKYPLKICDIRRFQLVEATKALNVQKTANVEEAPPEEEKPDEEQRLIESIKSKESESKESAEPIEPAEAPEPKKE